MHEPFAERRAALQAAAAALDPAHPAHARAPTIRVLAETWFLGFESAGVDGLIVKPLADPYLPGQACTGQGEASAQR